MSGCTALVGGPSRTWCGGGGCTALVGEPSRRWYCPGWWTVARLEVVSRMHEASHGVGTERVDHEVPVPFVNTE